MLFARRILKIFPWTSGFCQSVGNVAQNVLWPTLPAAPMAALRRTLHVATLVAGMRRALAAL